MTSKQNYKIEKSVNRELCKVYQSWNDTNDLILIEICKFILDYGLDYRYFPHRGVQFAYSFLLTLWYTVTLKTLEG